MSCELHEQLLELVLCEVAVAGLGEALDEAGREQLDPCVLDSALGRDELADDCGAVAALFEAAGDRPQLALGAAEPVDHGPPGMLGDPIGVHVGVSLHWRWNGSSTGAPYTPEGMVLLGPRTCGEAVRVKLEQIHLESLGHASYVIASDDTGYAMVVDPRRDVEVYVRLAHQQGYRVRWVVDTHQHNDYLSGLLELVQRTGATALGSAYADGLGYDHEPLRDRQQLEVGEVGIEVLHTPGHTPEHLGFLVYDGEQSRETPALLLSGGALLVGDLARTCWEDGPRPRRRRARSVRRCSRPSWICRITCWSTRRMSPDRCAAERSAPGW